MFKKNNSFQIYTYFKNFLLAFSGDIRVDYLLFLQWRGKLIPCSFFFQEIPLLYRHGL